MRIHTSTISDLYHLKMAAGTGGGAGVPLSLIPPVTSMQQGVAGRIPAQLAGPPASTQQQRGGGGGGESSLFPEGERLKELALQIHGCLFQAQKLKLASAQQQQQQQPSAAVAQQVGVVLGQHTHTHTHTACSRSQRSV